MTGFDPTNYGPSVAALLATPRLAPLGPGTPDESIRPKLHGARSSAALPAGLWLYFDFLDESHRLSQEIETPDGSFWHAIMHRREPDADNSKYWWAGLGHHPVLDSLRDEAACLGYTYTTPQAFVDFCEHVRGTGSADEELARRVQGVEWELLFDWCYREAAG